jgi:peptidoglycan hydrolase-like protein with peptidoglycan-binding domain
MRPDRRRTLPLAVALATLLLSAVIPDVAAYSARYPTQSLGDRGADVRAIQGLLTANGVPTSVNGLFTTNTVASVKAFQAAHGLTADGIVGETTWARLILPLDSTSTGPAVVALQTELRAKRLSKVVADGVYGETTASAVRGLQKHSGLPVTGVVDATTWRYLIWHFQFAPMATAGLCDYSVGNGTANWGTASAIAYIDLAARRNVAAGRGRVALGDIGYEHGGDIAGHETHERGLDVDLRLIRKDRLQCQAGSNYRFSTYDRSATRALILAIRAFAPGHVKLIYFNDPVLIKEGLTRRLTGHDDHLHVRFCEKGHVDPLYRC